MWEALDKASYYGLGNLTVILDVNRLGQCGPTELGWSLEAYRHRVEAFGCRARVIDGHDVDAIDGALVDCRAATEQVSVIIARTQKGQGVPEVEDVNGWHGRALPPELAARAVAQLGGVSAIQTRQAFGDALKALAARPDVVVLDGEVANSTYTEEFAATCPERFFEMFIAEQQMIAAAVGMSVRGYVPFAATFAAFVSRAADFIRMAGISGANIRINGSHAGVEIGADGPSQMGLEDLALMQAIHGSTVLYPSDATSSAKLTVAMADIKGVSYLRTTRGAYPVLYGSDEPFPLGGAKVLRSSDHDDVCLLGAGVTVHQCLEAAAELALHGIFARVVDAYSLKPMDPSTLLQACDVTSGRLVVVEDHHAEGGLGAAVSRVLTEANERGVRTAHLAVRELPMSGTSAELLDFVGISAAHISVAARSLVAGA